MGNKSSWKRSRKYDEYDDVSSRFHCQWISDLFYFVFLCMLYSFSEGKITFTGKKSDFRFYSKLDIENPIIRINTAFKGCSSLEKISVLPRIYHN